MIAHPASETDPIDATDDLAPSKTQRKKDMAALQSLGVRLTRLNAAQLNQVELPERLREAIDAARRITAHEARRRQMQYIGKLMRGVEAAPIEQALERLGGESQAAVSLMHRCEQWRDRLLDDDGALTLLLDESPVDDVQLLRSMIRAARRERDAGQPPRHARELYRWLHQHLEADAARPEAAPSATETDLAVHATTDRKRNRSR